MGHKYTYRCEACSYEEHFNQGHGYLVHSQSLDNYIKQRTKFFHYKTHNVLKQLAKENNHLFLKAGFQVYKCPKCRILFDKVEVIVSDAKKIVHKSDFRCNVCRARLKLTNIHRLKTATCPKCHKKTFHIDHSNHHLWD